MFFVRVSMLALASFRGSMTVLVELTISADWGCGGRGAVNTGGASEEEPTKKVAKGSI